ncbi:hypothetical protein C3L33_07175, partial [Rhododendron williamsianum]
MRRVLASEVLSAQRHRWLEGKRTEEADHLVGFVYNQSMDSTTGGVVNRRATPLAIPPGPKPWPIVGSLPGLLFTKKPAFRLIHKMMEDMNAEIICINLWGIHVIPVTSPEITVDFLKRHDAVFSSRPAVFSADITSRGYLTTALTPGGEQWKKMRRVLTSEVLSAQRHRWLVGKRTEEADHLELMIATVDNPSNAVEWALAEMINQPALLERATEELDRVVGRNRLVQESDLSQLNYVKSCVRESFRLHPIAPFNVPHVSTADATVAGYFIPKGSHVLLSRPGLGRNPRVWDEPLQFRPERHLKRDGSDVMLTDPDLKMLSFSIGRRGCPGVTLGSTMTTMLMARLLQGFSWEVPPTVSKIELKESAKDLFLAEPLLAKARPRLAEMLYHNSETFMGIMR